jgi:putative transcriptional regulator
MENLSLDKGMFLVSEPFLPDPNFKRTVVILTEHDDDGSIGFVLNRKTNLLLNDVLEDFPEFPVPLYLGGPVEQNTLHYVHNAQFNIPGSKTVVPGLNWGGDFEVVRELIENGLLKPGDIRFFIGYSGWSPEQLQAELDDKAWILASANKQLILMEEEEDLWRRVLKQLGKEYSLMANYPEDPRLN